MSQKPHIQAVRATYEDGTPVRMWKVTAGDWVGYLRTFSDACVYARNAWALQQGPVTIQNP